MKFNSNIISLVTLVSISTSCASWVESAKRMIDGDKAQENKEAKWVPKSQYNDLLLKYNNLSEEHSKLKEMQSTMPAKNTGYNQIDELSKSVENSDAIDVFAEENVTDSMQESRSSSSEVSALVATYNKAKALKENGKIKAALGLFQSLERSNVEQVVVRAKYQTGQIYFEQNQFDLALQVYESIISNNSYSSVVLEALQGAIVCSSNLGLADKKARYQSVLRDFFGINS